MRLSNRSEQGPAPLSTITLKLASGLSQTRLRPVATYTSQRPSKMFPAGSRLQPRAQSLIYFHGWATLGHVLAVICGDFGAFCTSLVGSLYAIHHRTIFFRMP